MDAKLQTVDQKHQDKLSILKKEMNTLINALYEDIAAYSMSIDPYRVPIHGIAHPHQENPVNLF